MCKKSKESSIDEVKVRFPPVAMFFSSISEQSFCGLPASAPDSQSIDTGLAQNGQVFANIADITDLGTQETRGVSPCATGDQCHARETPEATRTGPAGIEESLGGAIQQPPSEAVGGAEAQESTENSRNSTEKSESRRFRMSTVSSEDWAKIRELEAGQTNPDANRKLRSWKSRKQAQELEASRQAQTTWALPDDSDSEDDIPPDPDSYMRQIPQDTELQRTRTEAWEESERIRRETLNLCQKLECHDM